MKDAVAIVGLGGVFPGADGPEGLWAGILAARTATREVPDGRWLIPKDLAYDTAKPAPDKVYSKTGCFVEGFRLDPGGLALEPGFLAGLDLAFHFALKAGREAFSRAETGRLDRRRVGVILGNIALPTDAFSAFSRQVLSRAAAPRPAAENRFAAGLPAGVLARALGLGGGAMTLDAACASSLYALKLAAEELLSGRADAMLAGGVSRPDCLYTQMGFSQLRALSASGRCSPFDASADGLVVGEGAGVFLLKRLEDALKAGDRIWAVLRGIGLSNDTGGSLLAPDGGGQLRAMRAAYAEAGWSPWDASLVECHATGTPVGDAIELASLRALWEGAPAGRGAVIGSVKSNVGHLLTGAGAAGLTKVLFALRDRVLPPSANFERPAPGTGLEAGPFAVLARPRPWESRGPRRAAVSAFGFGGINAHVLLEEWLPSRGRAASPKAPAPAPVAIVGMEARFGGLSSLREFQAAVLSGVQPRGAIEKISAPASAFRIPPKEIEEMLPQQLLMLATAAAALADAKAAVGDHERTGVFIGMELDCNTANFHFRWSQPPALRDAAGPPLTANRTMGALGGIIASRIAREFKIGGPSFTLACEEASGLRALEAGVRALQRGELDCALVGAVDLCGDARHREAEKALGRHPATTDGAAAFVLKRLDDAVADADRIYAVVRGLGVCSGPGARERAAEAALSESGRGMPAALLDNDFEALGAAGAASAAASLAKAALALHARTSPPADQEDAAPGRAAISALGLGGTCVHAVLEERRQPAGGRGAPEPAALAAAGAHGAAHARFLSLTRFSAEAQGRLLALRSSLLNARLRTAAAAPPRLALDRARCLEFARGRIAPVLGRDFAPADAHPTRVRLPDEPLMLVDRVLSIEGEPRSLGPGKVVTEHDVRPGAWYLDGGRVPTCVAVEAGQADLLLSGYLGIDLATKGLARYRLLDAVVSFSGELPPAGKTIRYDIRIERFARQGGAHFFFFNFDGTVNGRPLLSMRDGCAGFFTEADLAAGKGIVFTELDARRRSGKRPADWEALAPMRAEALDDDKVEALRRGDLAVAFGPAFSRLPLENPLRLPGGRMRLIDRVLELDPAGGRYGLGLLRAEADIRPDDWFLTCHFVDDQVMPGTLMYECCLHALRVFLMRMGWVGEDSLRWEPVPGVKSRLKCRGQVLPTTKKAVYEIWIKELGYGPEPYALADALMYSDGKPIVLISDMSLRLAGARREDLRSLWASRPAERRPAIFDTDKILAFAVGKPSEAFGDRYKVFDRERVIARLPGPPYQFLDRVVSIEGAEPWTLEPGGVIEAEYDVPPDAWYFAAARRPSMPFAVLLEVALQPCGWLAAYLGSALKSETNLSFRNLGGKAAMHREVGPNAGTLVARIKITKVSLSGGMIIQSYDMSVRTAKDGVLVYAGDTYFGFFSKQALAEQRGILGAAPYAPSQEEARRGSGFAPEDAAPLPDPRLRMIDSVSLHVPDGGPKGLGFLRATKRVDPAEWFFKAHFHQDPVCPGSLGLESFLQLLTVAASRRWGPHARFLPMLLGVPHEWVYRGQILPTNAEVVVEAAVTGADDRARVLTGDGFLSVDGLRIYQMKGFGVAAA